MKKFWIAAGITLAAGASIAAFWVLYSLPLDPAGRPPVQPIAFSHRVHAGENGIHCLFCHRSAPSSPVAGIPSVADCRSCHLFISRDAPEIGKLMGFWDRREPIPWIRVHRVPDHVHFPHMMHLRAGVECAVCHGEVAEMERIGRSASLKMGWCLKCHRQHRASIDCWSCHI